MLADTSAWIEFLRATGSAPHLTLAAAVRDGEGIVVLDVVLLELLSGAASDARAMELRRFLAAFTAVPAASPADHELAAELYRAARRAGETIRSLFDCLVAAAALRLGLPVLARDRDFEVLARVSPLRLI